MSETKYKSIEEAVRATQNHDPKVDAPGSIRVSTDVATTDEDRKVLAELFDRIDKLSVQDRLTLTALVATTITYDAHSPTINFSLTPQAGANAGKFIGVSLTVDPEFFKLVDKLAEQYGNARGDISHTAEGTSDTYEEKLTSVLDAIQSRIADSGGKLN